MSTIPASTTLRSPLIRLESVVKRFPANRGQPPLLAVDHVSLRVGAGERLGIIGSSGAGKSTLLRLINLLETPDAGSVHLGDRELTRLSRPALRTARAGIGMIFQQFNLLQNATVYDNVAFPLTIRRPRLSRADRRLRVLECLKIVGLSGKLDSHPAQLSGGQKQRVAIARALATRPSVMLCDEPTSALDSETTRAVLDVLVDINVRLGVTLVVVTHELAVARTLCEHVAVMADGRIVEDIALGREGDRLDGAIARANRSGDVRDASAGDSNHPAAQAPALAARRVGGLPLPGKAAPVGAGQVSRVASAATSASSTHRPYVTGPAWSTPARDGADAPARRVGGLPMPRKSAAVANEVSSRREVASVPDARVVLDGVRSHGEAAHV